MQSPIIKWTGNVSGKPESNAETKWPNKPMKAPATGPSAKAPKKAGNESKATEPMILMFAPTIHSANKIAVKVIFLILLLFISYPHLLINKFESCEYRDKFVG